ncbi:hypothetical protein Pint_28531 [Pistacia integerrima]|uniref:Uncharacterized protein n=1 Tax=Pistacia integerrima TaxID=434235 RepID=A0ACC0YQH5_9ROSI|nr:hypothetical protein Pint_28531 [Pistacia integerrima]
MHRCFLYPPPGYVKNGIRDEALIELIKGAFMLSQSHVYWRGDYGRGAQENSLLVIAPTGGREGQEGKERKEEREKIEEKEKEKFQGSGAVKEPASGSGCLSKGKMIHKCYPAGNSLALPPRGLTTPVLKLNEEKPCLSTRVSQSSAQMAETVVPSSLCGRCSS